MKIAVFIKSTTFHKTYGGMETQNKLLCEELARRGYQVTVFSPQLELMISDKNESGVRYEFIPCDYTNSLFSFINPNSWFKKSYDHFIKQDNERNFDIIISQSSAALGIIKRRRFVKASIISVSHGTTISEYKSYLSSAKSIKSYLRFVPNTLYTLRNFFGRQREFIHGSDVNVAVSNFVKDNLISETFVEENKVIVINNGIDPNPFERFQRTFKTARNLKVMYSGRVDRSKGVFQLLKLAKKFPELQINFYGTGDAYEDLAKQVTKDSINNVVMHGKVLYKDMVAKYFENDVLILPTVRVEGLPMVIIEAQFSKLPIIASDMGGITDAIKNGKTGLLINAGDFEDLADKIKILMSSMETRKKVSEGAYNFATENFTITKMTDRYEQIIRKLRK